MTLRPSVISVAYQGTGLWSRQGRWRDTSSITLSFRRLRVLHNSRPVPTGPLHLSPQLDRSQPGHGAGCGTWQLSKSGANAPVRTSVVSQVVCEAHRVECDLRTWFAKQHESVFVAKRHRGQPGRRPLKLRDALQQLHALHVRGRLSPLEPGCLRRLHGAGDALRQPARPHTAAAPASCMISTWRVASRPHLNFCVTELVRNPEALPHDSIEVEVGSLGERERVCVVEGWCRACVGSTKAEAWRHPAIASRSCLDGAGRGGRGGRREALPSSVSGRSCGGCGCGGACRRRSPAAAGAAGSLHVAGAPSIMLSAVRPGLRSRTR